MGNESGDIVFAHLMFLWASHRGTRTSWVPAPTMKRMGEDARSLIRLYDGKVWEPSASMLGEFRATFRLPPSASPNHSMLDFRLSLDVILKIEKIVDAAK